MKRKIGIISIYFLFSFFGDENRHQRKTEQTTKKTNDIICIISFSNMNQQTEKKMLTFDESLFVICFSICWVLYVVVFIIAFYESARGSAKIRYPVFVFANSIVYIIMTLHYFTRSFFGYGYCVSDIVIPLACMSVIGSSYILRSALWYGSILETRQKIFHVTTPRHQSIENISYYYKHSKIVFAFLFLLLICAHLVIPGVTLVITKRKWYPYLICATIPDSAIISLLVMMMLVSSYYLIFCILIKEYSDSMHLKKQFMIISFSWMSMIIILATLKSYSYEQSVEVVFESFMICMGLLPFCCENLIPILTVRLNKKYKQVSIALVPERLDDTRNMIFTKDGDMQSILLNYLYEVDKTVPCQSVIKSVFLLMEVYKNKFMVPQDFRGSSRITKSRKGLLAETMEEMTTIEKNDPSSIDGKKLSAAYIHLLMSKYFEPSGFMYIHIGDVPTQVSINISKVKERLVIAIENSKEGGVETLYDDTLIELFHMMCVSLYKSYVYKFIQETKGNESYEHLEKSLVEKSLDLTFSDFK